MQTNRSFSRHFPISISHSRILKESLWLFVVFYLIINSAQASSQTVDIFQDIERGLMYPNYNQGYSPQTTKPVEEMTINRPQNNRRNNKQVQITLEENNLNTSERDEIVKMEQMAYIAANNGYYEAAIELYKHLLRKEPNNYYIKFGLASVYQEIGQLKQAKPLYLQLLHATPDDAKVINNLLNIIIDETPYEAAYLLSDLADKNPKSAYINAQAGIAHQNIGEYARAYEFLNKAANLEPNNIQYRFNLAVVLDKNQEYTAAISNYRMVLSNYNPDLIGEETSQAIEKRIAYLETQRGISQ